MFGHTKEKGKIYNNYITTNLIIPDGVSLDGLPTSTCSNTNFRVLNEKEEVDRVLFTNYTQGKVTWHL